MTVEGAECPVNTVYTGTSNHYGYLYESITGKIISNIEYSSTASLCKEPLLEIVGDCKDNSCEN